MNRHFMVRLLAAAALVAGACSRDAGKDGAQGPQGPAGSACTVASNGNGTKTISCTDGTSVTVSDGAPGADGVSCTITGTTGSRTLTCTDGTVAALPDGAVDFAKLSADEKAALDMTAVITGVSHAAAKPVVSFKVSDHLGKGVRGLPASDMRLSILKLAAATNGGNDTWVSYLAANATTRASTETATSAQLADNGDGTYAYTFAKDVQNASAAGTTYDASAAHRVVLLMYATYNPYAPVNATLDYVPATGPLADQNANEKISGAACLECHGAFRAKAKGTGAFHSGQRYDVKGCVACHNDQRRFSSSGGPNAEVTIASDGAFSGTASVLNGEAIINLPVFIHKIHMGEELALKGSATTPAVYAGVQKPYETHYPQAIANCAKCHKNVAQAANYKNKPSRRACGACHDGTSFLSPAPTGRTVHAGTFPQASDAGCALCHGDTTATGSPYKTSMVHLAVAPPDANSTWHGGTNGNTNAAWLAAAGHVPAGAAKITYELADTGAVTVASNKVSVKFRVKRDGTVVNLNAYAAGAELLPGFVGAPSIYVAFSVPQDGIAAPADFNVTGSGYLKTLWTTGNTVGTLTGPDASGYYTATLNKPFVPSTAKMVTGGVGYTYSLSSAPPLTQVDLPAYPYNPASATADLTATGPDGKSITLKPKEGGLIVAAPNVWKVASGFSGRRSIVSTAKCNACHEQLGAAPSFHAGNRNDAPTCAFCHNPNRTSSAWSANAKDFVHGIHAASKRSVDFNWHAVSPEETFGRVTYPGVLSSCEQCHLAGTYDFSASASASALPNLLASTVATGKYDPAAASAFTFSPYVSVDNTTDYGVGFSMNATDGTITDATAATLVISPVTAACVSCHDGEVAKKHMTDNSGLFYVSRADAAGKEEGCLECHGPGSVVSIANVHAR